MTLTVNLCITSGQIGGSLESVLQQSKASDATLSSPTAGMSSDVHITHPILQSQLKAEPDGAIPLLHNVSIQ